MHGIVTLNMYIFSALFCAADGETMKTVVALLLLCLCDPGQTDCQADCVSCSNILPKPLSFNTMVNMTPTHTHTHTHIHTHTHTHTWTFARLELTPRGGSPLCPLVLKTEIRWKTNPV